MGYRNLGEYIRVLELKGQLVRINAQVDPELEITEVTDRIVKSGGPALLFQNVKGHTIPVLTNMFGTLDRMKLALGTTDLDLLGAEIGRLLQPGLPQSWTDKLKMLGKFTQLSSFIPRVVRSGPCKEVIEKDPDLTLLPVLKCWPEDAGRFITLPLVITKDPETGQRNVGMYRMQVYDSKTTGMHWHIHKDGAVHYEKANARGRKLEAAVALGGDPASIYAATAPLPQGVDELLFAGFIRREPVEVVRCETVDLEVPAEAEIIIEGYVDSAEPRLEGPFGDHTGYYSLADYYPVFHVTCITRRRNPIYPATVVGRPVMEDAYIAKATERLFLPLIRLQLPEVVDVNFPLEGVVHNCVVVSIKKRYPGHARKVMHAVWGMGQLAFTKLVVVVDDNVAVQDMNEVWWRVFNNIDPRRDVVLTDGPLDALDHSSPQPAFGAKMGIDATRKWPGEGHDRQWPDDIIMSREIKALVDRKWKEYGL